MNLGDALDQAGILTGLQAPGWFTRLSSRLEVAPGFTPDAGRVSFPTGLIPGIAGGFDLRVTGDHTRASLSIPLGSLHLDWAGGGTAGDASGALTVDVTPAGEVRCRITGSGVLRQPTSPLRFAGPGGTGLDLRLTRITLHDVPAVEITGFLRLTGIPAATAEMPFTLRWDSRGLSGSATGTVGTTIYSVGWAGGHDPRPTSLVIDVPLPADVVPGVTTRGRLRVLGARAVSGIDLKAEVVASAEGAAASTDPKVVTAATLLAACAAAGTAPTGLAATSAVGLAGATLSTALHSTGSARVTRARIDLATPTSAVIDYVTELGCDIDAGIVGARTTSPMRAAVTGLRVDWSSAPVLDWRGATLDLADPGQWTVTRPKGLLQIDQVRSGHGSQWFELDLRFALDLGPVEVQRATVRVVLESGRLSVSMRGFGVGVTIPGLVSGSGSVSFTEPGSALHAALVVDIVPLNLAVAAALTMQRVTDQGEPHFQSLQASIGADLPAPIPLANTGLGLFGLKGTLGINREARFPASFEERLDWTPAKMAPARDRSTFGLEVAVGTLPDLGHAFGAVGRLAVTTPEVAVVAAVAAKLLAGRPRVTDAVSASGPRLRGVLAVLPGEVGLAIQADYRFPESGFTLFEGVAPVEARWTAADPGAWFVHLGTDRSRPPGPIRLSVLPDLLPGGISRSEAFLMVHGDGITGLPIATSDRGLVVAAGVDISTKLVALPAVAEIWARGMVAVSTKPVFLTGRAEVGGGLRLGPFRLGVSASLDLQVGPGSTYAAKLRICGEIDLWLFEISGCVTIAIGNQQQPAPAPPDSPVASITVADHRGVEIKPLPGQSVPVCWPDATVQVAFAPAPSVPSPHLGRFVVGTAPYPRSGTLSLGPTYRADYRLTGLDLRSVPGAATPPGPPPANLPATWQTKPGQPAISADGAAVLSLLTHDNALWTAHLADGGIREAVGPARRHECRDGHWPARAGWAVGGPATERRPHHWWLPPLPRDPDHEPGGSLDSHLHASTTTRWPAVPPFGRVEASAGNRSLLPLGALATAGRSVLEDVVAPSGDRYPGWLVLPDVEWNVRPEQPQVATTTIQAGELVVEQGVLLLVVHAEDRDQLSVRTYADGGFFDWDEGPAKDLPDGIIVTSWTAPDVFESVHVVHPLVVAPGPREEPRFHGVGIVAVGGVTERAVEIAVGVSRNKPFTRPSPIPPQKPPPGHVPVLSPGVRYQVTVGWAGEATAGGQTASGSGSPSALLDVARLVSQRPAANRLHTATDVFHPAMLARYLRGYRPEGGPPWFPDDPVAAVLDRSAFTVAHAYGLTPTLVVTRTDEPGRVPLTPLQVLAEAALLRKGELAMLELVGTVACALPHGPVALTGHADLLPGRAYDLTVSFPRSDGTELDLGRLPAVAFRTSRWTSARAMFAQAGILLPNTPADPAATVRVAAAPPGLASTRLEQSDGALAAALGPRAGLPLDRPIRSTVLVAPPVAGGSAAAVAGVLLECVEPLRRGRALSDVWMSGGGFGGADWRRLSDRSGTALLFIPPAPVTLARVDVRWRAWGADVRAQLTVPSLTATRTLVGLGAGAL